MGLTLATVDEIPAEVQALADARQAARAAKDWSEADRARAELASLGWVVEDTASGPKLHRA